MGWRIRTHVHGGGGRRRGGVRTALPRGTVMRRTAECLVLDAERLLVAIVEARRGRFVMRAGEAPEGAVRLSHRHRHQPADDHRRRAPL